MQMLDGRHTGVGVQRDLVLAVGTQLREGRRQRRQRLQRGLAAHEFVVIESRSVFGGRHRHHRAVEHATRPRRGGLVLGLHPVGVQLVAAQSLDGRVEIGRDAHVHRPHRADGGRVGPQRAAVGEQRNARDRFHPAGHRQAQITRAQPGRGVRDGVDARGAEPVDGQTRDVIAPAGQQRRGAGDVGALLVDLGGAAHDDVVHLRRVQAGPGGQCVLEVDQQVGGGAVGQRTLRGGFAARGAHVIQNKGVAHLREA